MLGQAKDLHKKNQVFDRGCLTEEKRTQKKINTDLPFLDTPYYLPATGSVDFPNGNLYWHHCSDGDFARILPNLFLNPSKFWLPQNTHNNKFHSLVVHYTGKPLLFISYKPNNFAVWQNTCLIMRSNEQSHLPHTINSLVDHHIPPLPKLPSYDDQT